MRPIYLSLVAAMLVVASCIGLETSTTVPATSTTEPLPTSTTSPATTSSQPATFPARRSDAGLGWEAIETPTASARCHQAVLATDSEIVFWGGNQGSCDYDAPRGDPGMAYNPTTGMWRQLPASPLESAVAATGVWTGSEIIICCGFIGTTPVGGHEIGTGQTAAFEPASGSWRQLSDSPVAAPFAESIWTGALMLVTTQSGVAGYDPSTGDWRIFSDPPQDFGRTNEIAWTGSELIVWPAWASEGTQRRVHQGMALDPTADTWRILPEPPAWPAAADIVYTGDALVIWGGLPANSGGSERAVGSNLDLDTNTWTELPEALPEPDACECNIGSQTLIWTGEYVLVSPGMFSTGIDPTTPVLIAYNPDTNTWILVDDQSPIAWGGRSLTVGERLVVLTDSVFYVSPPSWQPTGDFITNDTWSQ